MSQTETHIGKLRKVDTEALTTEQWCRKLVEDQGKVIGVDDDWKDEFCDSDRNYYKYKFYGNDLYEIFDHTEVDGDDINIMTDNGDDTYSFVMQFYNGVTCLDECLEDGLKRLRNE